MEDIMKPDVNQTKETQFFRPEHTTVVPWIVSSYASFSVLPVNVHFRFVTSLIL